MLSIYKKSKRQRICETIVKYAAFFQQLKNHRKLFIKQRCFLFSNNENKKEKSLDAT